VAFGGKRESVSVSGVKAEFLEAGSGKPLLFLHSSWAPDAFSSDYLGELAKTHKVIAPYHPGYGHNPRPKHFRGVEDIAYFYLDLMQQLGLTGVTLAGASFGGWIASEIAVRSTARISQLILVSPFGIKVGSAETRDFTDFWAVDDNARRDLEFSMPEFRSIDYLSKPEEEVFMIARGREAEALYGWKPFMHNPQLKHWLHRVDVPTLVIAGDDDRIVAKENINAYTRLIPNSRIETIAGAGHHPHIEQPSAFSRCVDAFASRQ
jgi:pimeloyl-ACP methyl ester carboxylesterase